ncbi:MAG: phage tail tape measure protein [Sarcina sp.]
MAGAIIKIGANSSEFQKQMKAVTKELKLVSSECSVASQKAKLFGTTQDQLGVKHRELTAKIQAQNQMMKLHQDRITGINQDTEKQKNKQTELNTKIDEATKKYKESVEQTGKNSEESKKLKTELEGLKEEYAKNEKAIEKNNDKLTDATIKMNNTEKALLQNQRALEDVNKEMQNSKIDKLADGFESLGNKATEAGKKMSVISAGIVGTGVASVAAFKEVDSGMDTVIKATGATGDAVDGLEESYKNLASKVNESFDSIGSALGEANTRFGFTGQSLEDCTEKFLQFAKINNTDATTSIQLVSRAMGDAGIESDKYEEVLDQLTVAAQKSGIGIDKLTENITKYGAPMRALGMDTKESIAIFASWELAGVNTEIAFSGMKAAIGKWGKEGKDARVEFKKTLKEIESAPNIADATAKAIEIFGQKAGPDLADAIKGGRFEYEDFLTALEGSTGTVTNTFNQVQDGTDSFGVAMNNVKLVGAELGEQIVVGLTPIMNALVSILQSVTQWFGGLNDGTKQAVIIVGALIAAIGPGLIIFGAMASGLSKIVKGFKDIKSFSTGAIENIKKFGTNVVSGAKSVGTFALNLGKATIAFAKNAVQAGISAAQFIAHKVATIASTVATNAMALAQAALNFIMSLNPITLVIIAIGALVAAIIVLWNKCEWFRNLVMAMFEALKIAWQATLNFFKTIWDWFVGLWNAAVELFKTIWQGVCDFFKLIWQGVCLYFETVWNFWKGIFEGVVNIIKTVWEGACTIFKTVWQGVCNTFKTLFEGFKTIFTTISNTLKTIWQGVCNIFSSAWNGVCSGITSVFTGVKNTVVGIAQSMTNTVIRAINWCITQLNKIKFSVPDWVPLIGGKSWGVNIPKVSEVNWLWKGGIIDSPTLFGGGFGVGDAYKGSGRQAEAVIPLETMYKKIAVIVNDVVYGNQQGNTSKSSGDTILQIENFNNNREIDIEQLVKELEFYRRKYT